MIREVPGTTSSLLETCVRVDDVDITAIQVCAHISISWVSVCVTNATV
jgi:hypothetical protein